MSLLRSALTLGAVLAAAAAAAPMAAAAEDDEVVLPSRVAVPLERMTNSVDAAADHVDDGEYTKAIGSLRAVRANLYRADKAVARAMAAPVDPEAETTTAPDAVIAFLAAEHHVVVTAAALFDANSMGLVDGLTHAVFRTLDARDRLLDKVIALDPEGAGADYADGMADTVADYDDEVANLGEALADDALSTGGRAVLSKAYTQVQATDAKVNAAFGGGE